MMPVSPHAKQSTALPPGFRKLELLGRGRAGTVYLVEDEQSGRTCALKLLKAETLPGVRPQFLEEIAALTHLSHPSVSRVERFAITAEGRPYVLIDTAGMRRKRSIREEVEELSVLHAVKAMSVADVVLLLVDATGEVAEQDLRIANLALRRERILSVDDYRCHALGRKKVAGSPAL